MTGFARIVRRSTTGASLARMAAAGTAFAAAVGISSAHGLKNTRSIDCVLQCPNQISGGIGEQMMLATDPMFSCPGTNSYSSVTDGPSAVALLCAHLAECEGETVQSLGGTTMPASAGGVGASSTLTGSWDHRFDPRGLWESLEEYCASNTCTIYFTSGDEDELVGCESPSGTLPPMNQETEVEEGEDFDCECCPGGGGSGGGPGPGGGFTGDMGPMRGGGSLRPTRGGKLIGDGGPNPQTRDPVSMASGHKLLDATDLTVAVPGQDFALTRHYTSSPDYAGASLAGNNWTLSAFGFIGEAENEEDPEDIDYILNGPALKNTVRFVKASMVDEWYPRGTSSRYMVPGDDVIIDAVTYDTIRLVEPGEWACEYVVPDVSGGPYAGLMVKWWDAYDNLRTYTYTLHNDVARLRCIFLNGTGYEDCDAVVRFWWFLGGAGDGVGELAPAGADEEVLGKLHFVEVFRRYEDQCSEPERDRWIKTNQVTYTYRMPGDESDDDVGSDGDLIMVVKKTRLNNAGEAGTPWRYQITQYRYHDAAEPGATEDDRANLTGKLHQLKLVISPEQLEYFAQRLQVLDSTLHQDTVIKDRALYLLTQPDFDSPALYTDGVDVQLLDLASKVVGYNWNGSSGNARVQSQYIQSSCGCSGAAQGLLLEYEYTDGYTIGGKDGLTLCVIEKTWDAIGEDYDEHRRIYYDMLEFGDGEVPYLTTVAVIEPSPGARRWVVYYAHASSGAPNILKIATPSAVDAYASVDDTSGAPTIAFHENAGMVLGFAYSGDNRLEERRVHEGWGSSGSPVAVSAFDLVSSTEFDATRTWLPVTNILYRTSGETSIPGSPGNDHQVTTFEYGFVGGGNEQPQWIKTTVEAELVAENGPGGTYDTFAVFNDEGELIWSRSADGVLTYRSYDELTGSPVKIVRDADKSAPDGDSGSALAGTLAGSLSTSTWGSGSPDELVTSYVVDELGRVVTTTSPGDVNSFTIRELRYFPDRPYYLYYAVVSLPHDLGSSETPRFDGPVTINWSNAAGKSIGSSDYRIYTGVTYAPAEPDASYVYPLTVNYGLLNTSGWGHLGLSIVRHTLTGTVKESEVWHDVEAEYPTLPSFSYLTTFAYDEIGRMVRQTAPNDTITEYEHDVLNRVLKVKIGKVPGTSGDAPVTVAEYFYDDPDLSNGPHQGMGNGNLNYILAHSSASTTRPTKRYFDYRDRMFKAVNSTAPHEFLVHDNLDRVIERGVFSDVPVAIDDDLGDRGLYSTTAYSQRGLVYRQQVATDAEDVSPVFLESHTWYDSVGRPIERWGPNAPATKTRFDAHGRATLVAMSDRGSDPAPGDTANHASADDLVGDVVLEQVEYAYTAAGRVDSVLTRHRRHDDASTDDELVDGDSVRTFVGYMYDGAQRPIRTLNYGTNDNPAGVGIFQNDDLPTWPLASLPDWGGSPPADSPIMTGVVYDERGMVRDAIDPLGRLTRTLYDDMNRRIAVVENFDDAAIGWNDSPTPQRWAVTAGIDDAEPDTDRVTSFVYDGASNVVQQIAHHPDSSDDELVQVTQYVYGTTVTGTGATHTYLASGDLLAKVHYPNESTGEPDTDPEYTVSYAYNRLGELQAATDQNGTVHAYTRDSAGRVTIDSVTLAGGSPVDGSVLSLAVSYDGFGRLDKAVSWSGAGATGSERNAVQFTYTPLWQVYEVFQDADSDIDTGSPVGIPTRRVEYGYHTSTTSGDNFSRLALMGYPTESALAFDYHGDAFNDTISRVTNLSISPGAVSGLVEYSYLGLDMFAVTDYVTPDVQLDRTMSEDGKRNSVGITSQSSGVYPGFDRFGRAKFHVWAIGDTDDNTGSALPTRAFLAAESYAYDAASNRTLKDTVQPVLGQNWNHIDWQYEYDGLDRLIEAKRGTWTGSMSFQPGSQKWELDTLGNWTAFMQSLNADGDYADSGVDLAEARDHNAANEIDQVNQSEPASATRPFVYDKAGNMADQKLRAGEGTGTRYYVHDAWNRLVRVDLDDDGPGTGDAAYPIAEYEYNPLHWRTVKVADVRPPSSNPTSAPTVVQRRVMYYDASWRLIEEHICDDWEAEAEDNRIAQNFWGLRYIDDLVYRREDRDLTNEGEDPTEPDWEEEESPGWFALTDVQFSVIAMITPTAKLVERVVYDPYGRARHYFATDYNGDATVNSGDFVSSFLTAWFGNSLSADWDRDGTVSSDSNDITLFQTDWTPQVGKDAGAGQISWRYDPSDGTTAEAPDNMIGYCGYVFNPETDDYTVRFRHYDPEIGRWLERDPLEYIDGMNAIEYATGRPITLNDPMGTDVGWANRGCNDPYGTANLVCPAAILKKYCNLVKAVERNCAGIVPNPMSVVDGLAASLVATGGGALVSEKTAVALENYHRGFVARVRADMPNFGNAVMRSVQEGDSAFMMRYFRHIRRGGKWLGRRIGMVGLGYDVYLAGSAGWAGETGDFVSSASSAGLGAIALFAPTTGALVWAGPAGAIVAVGAAGGLIYIDRTELKPARDAELIARTGTCLTRMGDLAALKAAYPDCSIKAELDGCPP